MKSSVRWHDTFNMHVAQTFPQTHLKFKLIAEENYIFLSYFFCACWDRENFIVWRNHIIFSNPLSSIWPEAMRNQTYFLACEIKLNVIADFYNINHLTKYKNLFVLKGRKLFLRKLLIKNAKFRQNFWTHLKKNQPIGSQRRKDQRRCHRNLWFQVHPFHSMKYKEIFNYV